jgi:NTE family protein
MSETGAESERERDRPTRVAIACQGGGSHTAFTAGVLRGLFSRWDGTRYDLVGISGASGGAFCAITAWYGLLTGGPSTAARLLDGVWTDLAATDPLDRAINDWTVRTARIQDSGVPFPRISPYDLPSSTAGQARIRRVLERYVDFDAIPGLCTRDAPRLVVGTVDVNGGEFETFVDEAVTPEAVLASAAVPDLFPGVEIHGHLHWDGLFSQNPPVNDLFDGGGDRKPEELWIVQINPQEREGVPSSLEEIADRRNELSGNLSLNQELRFIERVNGWIDAGHLPADRYSRTEIRRLPMGRRYDYSTKLDRRPAFLRELVALGEERAAAFLADAARDDAPAPDRDSPAPEDGTPDSESDRTSLPRS